MELAAVQSERSIRKLASALGMSAQLCAGRLKGVLWVPCVCVRLHLCLEHCVAEPREAFAIRAGTWLQHRATNASCWSAGSPLQCQVSGKDQLGQGQQEGSTSTALPAMPRAAQMMPNPARLLSKELSLEGVIGSMSMDRSLSEFLHEVTCL